MRTILLAVLAATLACMAGCPWLPSGDRCSNQNMNADPNSPGDPNSPAGNVNANDSDVNENAAPSEPWPDGTFTGEIGGTYEVTVDDVTQPAVVERVPVRITFESGGLVSLSPIGPLDWWFGWAPPAELRYVGAQDTTGMFTNTSHIDEAVTLTGYEVDEERVLITIEMSFSSHFYSIRPERIEGTSTQTIEIRRDEAGRRASVSAVFDFIYTPGLPSNPGTPAHYREYLSGAGLLTAEE